MERVLAIYGASFFGDGHRVHGVRPGLEQRGVGRRVSCVSLHAVWSAIVAMAIYRKRARFSARADFIDRAGTLLTVMWLAMMLHALYDTLLKKEMRVGALAVAVVSLLLFFHRYRAANREPAAQAS